jgi:hypothetical protein
MKIIFSLDQFYKNNFLLTKTSFCSRFGSYNNYYASLLNKKFMVVNINFLLISLKKVILITYKIGLFRGIFLSYISKACINEYEKFFINIEDDNSGLSKDIGYGYNILNLRANASKILFENKEYMTYLKYFLFPNKKKENFFLLFINGLYGFISNFNKVFLKHISNTKGKRHLTDYDRLNLPSIVFITKNSYNEYYNIFRIFIKKRIICIRTFSLIEEVDINIGYNLSVNDCSKVFSICNEIYKLVYLVKNKKW